MRRYLLVCLMVVSSLFAIAQDDSSGNNSAFPDSEYKLEDDEVETTHTLVNPLELQTTQSYQRETVSRHDFDEAEWRKIVGDADFTEFEKPKKEQKAESKAQKERIPWSGTLLRILSYGFIIVLALFLVWYIVRNVSFDMHIQRSKVEDDPDKPVENIETLDIQTMLDQAAREGNFKLAIRLHYLRLLKQLNEIGVIVWKKDKTNRDYLSELFSRDFHFNDIRKLTLFYESVWYGDHMLPSDTFQAVQSQFETVHQRLANETVT